MTILLPPIVIMLAASQPAMAAFEDLDALDARIAAIAGPGAAQPLDRRLKLSKCAGGAAIEPMAGQGLAVRCASTGWRIRVPLMAQASAASSAPVVRRGENVEILIGGGNYEISAAGTALEDGHEGKAIRVKFLTSQSAIVAKVAGAGKVFIED